nr:hypothetical protein [Mycoplasmopsis bovis]
MVKLSEWLKNWNRKRKRREESPNNALGAELAPNKFLRPLAYKEWQIVGNLFEFNETSKMHKQDKTLLLSSSIASVAHLLVYLVL